MLSTLGEGVGFGLRVPDSTGGALNLFEQTRRPGCTFLRLPLEVVEGIRQRIGRQEALHDFLWRPAADPARTKDFQGKRHDDLLRLLRDTADARLPGSSRVVITQSLQDAGCDILIDWGEGFKYGVQLKSHHDIGETDFAAKTVRQIQDSREHGLKRLYVLLAGDLTDHSQEQKVRGLEARVSRQNDGYVRTVSPERLWTLLFGNEAD
jgi:hypothetical protein